MSLFNVDLYLTATDKQNIKDAQKLTHKKYLESLYPIISKYEKQWMEEQGILGPNFKSRYERFKKETP